MDLAVRQLLQQAVTEAVAGHGYVTIYCTDGNIMDVRPDLICYATYIEATDQFGIPVTLSYSQIEDAGYRPAR